MTSERAQAIKAACDDILDRCAEYKLLAPYMDFSKGDEMPILVLEEHALMVFHQPGMETFVLVSGDELAGAEEAIAPEPAGLAEPRAPLFRSVFRPVVGVA